MDDDSDQDNIIEEDYYAFLNVSKTATADEIHQAFRRHSRLYHPDKHIDPILKKKAEILFSRTNKAYEVLKDPHQRAIYDSLGVKGLETKGWEIVQRTQTPQEIREEYERLAREREQKKLEQRTNPTGNITIHVNATDLFSKYDDEYASDSLFSGIEITGMTFEQSIEAPLTLRDKLILYGQLDTQNGVGIGTINVAARRTLSAKNYVELDVGGGNGPTMTVKGYHALSDRLFYTGALTLQLTPEKAQFGIGSTLGMQLDKQTVGYLTYKNGFNGAMSTRIVRNNERSFTSFSIQFGYLNTYANLSYTYKMPEKKLKLRGALRVGTTGYFVEYGAEKRISKHSFLSAAVRVGVPTGVSLRIKLMRASQTYLFPIHLCDEVLPAPVFYATVAPLVTWTIVKKLIIDPVVKEQREKEREKQKELNRERMLEKQREAKAAVDLMVATFSRIRSEEEAKGGLVISKALYGRFVYPDRKNRQDDIQNDMKEEVIDVTVPLQCLVVNSRLVLHDSSKSELPGFYDPCFGEEKQLLLQYLFHRQTHECLIKDYEALRIPLQSHRVNTT